MTSIYTLSDPRNEAVKYIGKTSMPLETRLRRHVVDKRNNAERSAWISELQSCGLEPKIELVDVVDDNNWKDEERFYISYFKFLGFQLLNRTVGGDGHGMKMTEEAIRKMVVSRRNGKGFGQSEYNKQRLAEGRERRKNRIGGYHTEEVRKRYSMEKREHLDSIRPLINYDTLSKPIAQCDKDGIVITEFKSIRQAGKAMNGNKTNILFALNGVTKTAYGYTWKYLPKTN